MEHICVNARFYFWDGKKGYTVEFAYALMTWYVFENKKEDETLFSKKIDPNKSNTPTRTEAEYILDEYLKKIKTLTV